MEVLEDIGYSKTQEAVTTDILRQLANGILPYLEFTSEFSGGENKPVTCLDSQLWYGRMRNQEPWFQKEKDGKVPPGTIPKGGEFGIMYKFYKKEVSNRVTILHRSAMPESVKVATFSSEILRRLKTTSMLLSKEETEEVLTTFMEDMKVMGYKEDWRKKVLKSALVGYMRILGKVEKGESERNGKGTVTLMPRRLKKTCRG